MEISKSHHQTYPFALDDYDLLLNTGNQIETLYHALQERQIGIIPITWIHGAGRGVAPSPVKAAPIKQYLHESLVIRIHDVLSTRMLPFIQRHSGATNHVHVHLPCAYTPQSRVIQPSLIHLIMNESYPFIQLSLTEGCYLKGLQQALDALPSDCDGLISVTLDCQTDQKTLLDLAARHVIMTALDDSQPAAGEGYVFLYFHRRTTQQSDCMVISSINTVTSPLLVNEVFCDDTLSTKGIETYLAFERLRWPAQKPPRWISPQSMCGDLGAATIPVCLLLAHQSAGLQMNAGMGLCLSAGKQALQINRAFHHV